MSLVLMNPTGRSAETPSKLAPRAVVDLDGMRVGLLDSSKHNSDHLLDGIAELLAERYGVKEFVRGRKASFFRPAPADLVQELASRCDVVITGVGD